MGSRQSRVSRPETKSVHKNSGPDRKNRKPDSINSGTGSSVSKVKQSSHNGPRYKFSTDIPEKYNQDYVCAIPRDPGTSFVYWENTPETLKKNGSGSQVGSKIVLTIKGRQKDSKPVNHYFDVCWNRNEQFIDLSWPGEQHRFEIGATNPQGDYSFISETGSLPPPQTDVSKKIDQKWFSEKSEQLIQYSAESCVVKKPTDKARGGHSDDKPYLGSSSF